MKMSDDVSNNLKLAFHNLILLHALQSAPPELHAALLNDETPEPEVIQHLNNHAKKLLSHIHESAKGKKSPAGGGSKGSTSQRASQLMNVGEPPASASPEPSPTADRDLNRQRRVGQIFKK